MASARLAMLISPVITVVSPHKINRRCPMAHYRAGGLLVFRTGEIGLRNTTVSVREVQQTR